MRLEFFLLGPPQVKWNESVLEISRRQVRALLYYLASVPSAVPQERLHYLFWSDKPEAVCRRNISHLLTHVRSSLPEPDLLIVNNSMIMLDRERIWCDVLEFKKLTRSIRRENRQVDFEKAVELYRGSFLDGLQFSDEKALENLVELERFNLERNFLNLLYKLVLMEKQNGNFETAVEYAYQYLAIDDLSEEVHRQLIVLHGLTGNRERVASQYQTCVDILQRELQTEPSRKTQFAYQDAMAGAKPGGKSALLRDSIEVGIVRNEPEFVNAASLNNFMDVLSQVKSGGVIMLYGELGIGKSSLFTKVLSGLGRGRLVLRARCDPGVRSLSYWPFKNLLLRESKTRPSIRALIPEVLGDDASASNSRGLATVGNTEDLPPREHQFAAFVDCILSLAAEQDGLVLCIEDLEWADADTLELFLHLTRYVNSDKLLLLGSYCCPDNDYLKDFLHKLHLAQGFMGNIKVNGMDLDETGAIVNYWVGDAKTHSKLIERLYQLSGGNPFYISEIMRWTAESEISIEMLEKDGSLLLPETINKTVEYRLGRLSRVERRVLEVGAVIGNSFEFDQISELTELSGIQVIDALDELVNRHFLFAHSARYQFSHELLRQFVLDGLSPARRQFLERNYQAKA